jgi:radical SAM superfamily enzyme YgiQ (UPF0313 family)
VAASLDVVHWIDKALKSVKHQSAYVVPLHLATIAALTPQSYQVQIWDEQVQGPVENNLGIDYDLVGLTGCSSELPRALRIADAFRTRGVKVVIGGAGVTSHPEKARGRVDAIFVGEAEYTWASFLADWEAGQHREVYRADRYADLADSPPPRWDSVAHLLADNYKTGAVQPNRGCPHTCEFCNVWIEFGRKVRTKPIPQILEEVRALETLGMKRILFATDNFIGNRRYAKQLLRELAPLNRSFRYPLSFDTEITVNAADDDDLLQLMREANFTFVAIGIESPNPQSLRETRKNQNTGLDLIDRCHKIAAQGLGIIGSLIVGFDSDGPDIFDTQFAFVQAAHIPIVRLNILRANDGTDLYRRLEAAGRLIPINKDEPLTGTSMRSNILFQNMSRAELFAGFHDLLVRVRDWRHFQERVNGFVDHLAQLPPWEPDSRLVQVAQDIKPVMKRIPLADARVIDELYSYAQEQAPAMIWNVAAVLMQHCYEAAQVPHTLQALEAQIALEKRREQIGTAVTAKLAR